MKVKKYFFCVRLKLFCSRIIVMAGYDIFADIKTN